MNRHATLVAVVLGVLGSVHTLPAKLDESLHNNWPIPQYDGSIRWMTRSEAIIEAMLTEPQAIINPRKLEKVRFFLYTQANPTTPIELDMDDPETLARSTFNFVHPTRFMVHGWNGGYEGGENSRIREALLLNGDKSQFNFIAVDWSVYGESINYVLAQNRCSKTGKIVAEFIDWLHDFGNLSFDTLAVYGHSLGAHVVGFAGKNVQRGQIHTIIGLDPAMPLFPYDDPTSRLSNTDARYVESIQTNGGMLGFYQPIGHAAFYPNGGKSQPGCGIDLGGGCAHGRSVEYLSEALILTERNGFHAVGCNQFENVKDGSCNVYVAGIRLGDPNNAVQARGIYYLQTNSQSPFGMGNIYI